MYNCILWKCLYFYFRQVMVLISHILNENSKCRNTRKLFIFWATVLNFLSNSTCCKKFAICCILRTIKKVRKWQTVKYLYISNSIPQCYKLTCMDKKQHICNFKNIEIFFLNFCWFYLKLLCQLIITVLMKIQDIQHM